MIDLTNFACINDFSLYDLNVTPRVLPSESSAPSVIQERVTAQQQALATSVSGTPSAPVSSHAVRIPATYSDEDLKRIADCQGTVFVHSDGYEALKVFAKLQVREKSHLPGARQLVKSVPKLSTTNDIKEGVRSVCLCVAVKELGHEWGIRGSVRCETDGINLERGDSSYMHVRVARALRHYFRSLRSDCTPLSSPLALLSKNDRCTLERVMRKGAEYGLADESCRIRATGVLRDLKHNKIVVIPTGWSGHRVEVVLYEDRKGNRYLTHVNRGETLNVGSSDMRIYTIGKKLTVEDITEILLSPRTSSNGMKATTMQFLEGKLSTSMRQKLNLQDVATIKKKEQKVGNCTWANAKGGFHAALVMVLMGKKLAEGDEAGQDVSIVDVKKAIEATAGEARKIYKGWTSYVRVRQLSSFLALQKSIRDGELKITRPGCSRRIPYQPFLQKDLYNAMAQICSKLVDGNRFSPDDPATVKMEHKIKAFMGTLDLSLAECVLEDSDPRLKVDPGQEEKLISDARRTILEVTPHALIVYKTTAGETKVVYSSSDGKVLDEEVKGDQKLKHFMRSKGLKYPVTVTLELLNRSKTKQYIRKEKERDVEEIQDLLCCPCYHHPSLGQKGRRGCEICVGF